MEDHLFQSLWGDRPSIQENWVEYKLYPLTTSTLTSTTIKILLSKVTNYLQSIITNHIWQHEPFRLFSSDNHQYLHGRSLFGDNIEDEWFIVHLLLAATLKFPDLVAHVVDNDGQFLCIETALVLPEWMTPYNSDNRVFLYNGTVHVIPLDLCANVETISSGVAIVQSDGQDIATSTSTASTAAPEKMRQAIFSRTEIFPKAATENRHCAHCFLPYRIAVLLCRDPNLVAAATRAFYYRTAEETALCAHMINFPPLSTSRVAVPVTFTRCLYAQLAQQEFPPPQPFQHWYSASSSNSTSPTQTHTRAIDIGMRLACGFEILCSQQPDLKVTSYQPNTEQETVQTDATLQEEHRFELFCAQLKTQHFFASVSNDTERDAKMKAARVFFNKQENRSAKEEKEEKAMDTPLSALSFPSNLTEITLAENDTSWLRGSTELDAKMATYTSTKDGQQSKVNAMQSAHEMASSLAVEMKEFVSATSDYSGVDSTNTTKKNTATEATETTANNEGFSLDLDKLLGILSGGNNSDATSKDTQDTEDTNTSDTDSKHYDEDEAIAEAMREELLESTLADTFTSAEDISEVNGAQKGKELKPLDLDVNLISNLLESYSAQQGLPGPVSNICGDLGVALPDDSKT